MNIDFYLRVIVAAILATHVAVVLGSWVKSLGLPPADFARGLADLTFADVFGGKVGYGWGVAVLYLNGAFFAFLYATVVGPHLPGPQVLHGAIYGALLFVGSAGFFAPVFMRAGMFLSRVHPQAWITAGIVHGGFGLICGWLCPVI